MRGLVNSSASTPHVWKRGQLCPLRGCVRTNISPAHDVHVEYLPHGPHRLVVRTSRRGRDNPGSTPGVDIYPKKNKIWCGRISPQLETAIFSCSVQTCRAPATAAGKVHRQYQCCGICTQALTNREYLTCQPTLLRALLLLHYNGLSHKHIVPT